MAVVAADGGVSEGGALADRTADEFADWVRPSLLAMTRLAKRLAPLADPADSVQGITRSRSRVAGAIGPRDQACLSGNPYGTAPVAPR
ncbi:MAG: hypothetical protein QOG80_1654 [Pseudonocardiales bacterium]|jgi:hypothetical protein|nr:hypothetical protein [Pseudonocardiales bacterium]